MKHIFTLFWTPTTVGLYNYDYVVSKREMLDHSISLLQEVDMVVKNGKVVKKSLGDQ